MLLQNYRETINQVTSIPKKARKSEKKVYNP